MPVQQQFGSPGGTLSADTADAPCDGQAPDRPLAERHASAPGLDLIGHEPGEGIGFQWQSEHDPDGGSNEAHSPLSASVRLVRRAAEREDERSRQIGSRTVTRVPCCGSLAIVI